MAEPSGYNLRILLGSRVGAYKLAKRDYSIGRSTGDNTQDAGRILLDDATVSRHHAELIWNASADGFSLLHKSTTNSTLIDGVALKLNKARKLRVGDQFQVGLVTLTLEQGSSVSSELTEAPPSATPQKSVRDPETVRIEPPPASRNKPSLAGKPRQENIEKVTSEVLAILTNLKAKE